MVWILNGKNYKITAYPIGPTWFSHVTQDDNVAFWGEGRGETKQDAIVDVMENARETVNRGGLYGTHN